ncbi:MAG: C39 family peptidase, partial [Lachnospira sp.]|nr:C39 family peptidase [Lachnospira sp.]
MRKRKKISLVLALSLLALAGVVFLYGRQLWMEANPKVEEATVTITVNNEIETSSVDFSQILKNNSIITITEEPDSLPESTELDVPFIDQNPQLPTGCEITSLAQVLNFYGF